jgi:multidrug resistance efflux pump
LALVASLLWLGAACSADPSPVPPATDGLERQVQTLIEQNRAMDAHLQKLSQDLRALQATVGSLDGQIWARQSAMAKNLAEVRNDLIPTLTGQVESLSHTLQVAIDRDQKERAGNETFAALARQGMAVQLERTQAQLTQLQATVTALAARLDQTQIDQQQAFAAEAAWIGALAGQIERYRRSSSIKRSTPRPSTPPVP